jgi:small-conductance mechanosensitive channel
MLKRPLKFWSRKIRHNRQQPLIFLACVACSIGILLATASTRAISTAAVAAFVINTLRILFVIYLLYSVVHTLRVFGKGGDRNT